MREEERPADVVLKEMAPMLSIVAARRLYAEQPELWRLGENGRARTIEDFNHHFNALVLLDVHAFRTHVAYCEELFRSRGFPLQWLSDAWRWMARVMNEELPPQAAKRALAVLDAGTKR